MNNREEFERFAVMYWGQKVGRIEEIVDRLINVNEHRIHGIDYLQLRSIDSLTDEEAEYVAKDLNHTHNNRMTNHEWVLDEIMHESLNGKSFDYLRKIGILVPWNGYSVKQIIEKGWAKIKQ